MTPEDVLIEAICAASRFGDSPSLREQACRKLRTSIAGHINVYATIYGSDAPPEEVDAAP